MAKFYDTKGKEINGRNILIRGELGKWCRQASFDGNRDGSFFAIGDLYSPTSRHLEFEIMVEEADDRSAALYHLFFSYSMELSLA
ncbi:MAG: hypothetical protein AAGA96_05295 [Verrucomicrobiota bacterium]